MSDACGATNGDRSGGGRMSTVMDRLVAAARSSRDGEFNTLDAVDRQTRTASVALAARIESIIAANRPAQPDPTGERPSPAADRDTRFDPEDEWELSGAPVPPGPRPAVGGGPSDRDSDSDSDSEDYPPTWLR